MHVMGFAPSVRPIGDFDEFRCAARNQAAETGETDVAVGMMV